MTEMLLLIVALITAGTLAIAFYLNDKTTKIIVLTLFVVLANAMYFALDGVKGWPAQEPEEVKGSLASVVIVEPNKKDSGGIYIGIFLDMHLDWYEYNYSRVAPKTFYVEYSNNRASQFEKAKKAIENGQKVRINGIPPKEGNGTEGEPNNDMGQGVISYLGEIVSRLMPKESDTYKPEPDIQIEDLGAPPDKGPEQ